MKLHSILIIVFISLTALCCRKSIELNLPKYQPKMVLEFYLQDGQPLACLLQESINYTDTTKIQLVSNALIILSYNGVSDTLFNVPYIDQKLGKIYNYYNPKILNLLPSVEYEVYVNDGEGKEMRGKTRTKEIVPIKNLTYTYDDANNVSAIIVLDDNQNEVNYYLMAAFKNTPFLGNGLVTDRRVSDILFNGNQFSFETSYNYQLGDTITARLYHLTEEHWNFSESASNAQSANGNPFGQPANILSNVTGGLGVFTTLNFDEKVVIVQ
jgi:hypothetical protein